MICVNIVQIAKSGITLSIYQVSVVHPSSFITKLDRDRSILHGTICNFAQPLSISQLLPPRSLNPARIDAHFPAIFHLLAPINERNRGQINRPCRLYNSIWQPAQYLQPTLSDCGTMSVYKGLHVDREIGLRWDELYCQWQGNSGALHTQNKRRCDFCIISYYYSILLC